jgi:hypothetical protein
MSARTAHGLDEAFFANPPGHLEAIAVALFDGVRAVCGVFVG